MSTVWYILGLGLLAWFVLGLVGVLMHDDREHLRYKPPPPRDRE